MTTNKVLTLRHTLKAVLGHLKATELLGERNYKSDIAPEVGVKTPNATPHRDCRTIILFTSLKGFSKSGVSNTGANNTSFSSLENISMFICLVFTVWSCTEQYSAAPRSYLAIIPKYELQIRQDLGRPSQSWSCLLIFSGLYLLLSFSLFGV